MRCRITDAHDIGAIGGDAQQIRIRIVVKEPPGAPVESTIG